jgi:hypothetical protein
VKRSEELRAASARMTQEGSQRWAEVSAILAIAAEVAALRELLEERLPRGHAPPAIDAELRHIIEKGMSR